MSDRTEHRARTPSGADTAASENRVGDGVERTDSDCVNANGTTRRAFGKRGLDTGSRGWRWLVVSILFAALPFIACAAVSPESPSELAAIALDDPDAHGGEILQLGVRMATLSEARRHLRVGARMPARVMQWAEVYFTLTPGDTAAKDFAGIAIPNRIGARSLGLNEHPGRF